MLWNNFNRKHLCYCSSDWRGCICHCCATKFVTKSLSVSIHGRFVNVLMCLYKSKNRACSVAGKMFSLKLFGKMCLKFKMASINLQIKCKG